MPTRRRKATARRPSYPAATPPPDNPLLRNEESNLDRLSQESIAGAFVGAALALAASPTGKPVRPPRGATPAAAVAAGELTRIAQLRLEVLRQARATGAAPGAAMTPAGPGGLNWVQLGP